MFSHKFIGSLTMKSNLLLSPAARKSTQKAIHRFDYPASTDFLQLTEKKESLKNQFGLSQPKAGRTNSVQQKSPK